MEYSDNESTDPAGVLTLGEKRGKFKTWFKH